MKKKLFLILVTALTALVLAGCVRMDISVTINKDGTVDVSMLEAIALDFEDYASDFFTEEEIAEFEAEGVTCTPYNEDGYSGYVLSSDGVPLEDLLSGTNDLDYLGTLADGCSLTKESGLYILDLDVFEGTDAEEMSYLSSIESFGGYMTFTLTLPTEPVSHNADSVSEDGKTLTWDLTRMNAGDTIHVEFKMPNSNMVPVIIGICAAIIVIAAAAVIIVVVLSKKKKKKAYAPYAAPYADPYAGAPGSGNAPPAGGAAPSYAKFCPKCGSASGGGRFCPNCGNDLSQYL